MKVAIISGSHRKAAQTLKVASYLQNRVESQISGSRSELISLSENPLPLWDESIWEGSPQWKELWGPISQKLEQCDGAFVLSPEWNGMVPAALKNFFLLVKKELAHKPSVIVSISAGRGGAYPVSELRSSSYKNGYICYIPDHLVIRNVSKLLNDSPPEASAKEEDQYIRERIDYTIKVFEQYAIALRHVRSSGVLDYKTYSNGM